MAEGRIVHRWTRISLFFNDFARKSAESALRLDERRPAIS
jgi:hypothetical protein